jgi:hypothetical protein
VWALRDRTSWPQWLGRISRQAVGDAIALRQLPRLHLCRTALKHGGEESFSIGNPPLRRNSKHYKDEVSAIVTFDLLWVNSEQLFVIFKQYGGIAFYDLIR